MRYFAGLLCATLLVSCGAPGPRTQAILTENKSVFVQREASTPFAVVRLSTASAKRASHWLDRTTAAGFLQDTSADPFIIGRGDILAISIVSTSESGYIDLTNSTLSPISTTNLPAQEVGSDGMVSVPPLGRVRAQGSTAQAFERFLERRLGEVLVDPSVIVSIADRRSARVSVLGNVANPGTYSINQNNTRLVEVIADAGGPDQEFISENLEIRVSRGGRTGRARLDEVYENPRLNIHIKPGDVVSVERPVHRLTVLGAGGANGTLIYNEADLSLAEALGRASGLINRRADRRGVFVYRELPTEAARSLGVDTTAFGQRPVPTIFNLDLSKPEALFAAKDFKVGEQDLVYISNSLYEEINALFTVFTNFAPLPSVYVEDATLGN